MIDSPENEIVLRAQMGDTEAESEILSRFSSMSRAVAQRFSRYGVDFDDLRQEADMGALVAIRSHSGHGLNTYVYRAVTGRMREALASGRSVVRRPRDTKTCCAEESLNAPVWHSVEGSVEKQALLPDVAPLADETVSKTQLDERVSALVYGSSELDETDRDIYRLRIVENRTLKVVAAELGLSYEGVRYREERLMTRILPRVLRPLKASVAP